MRMEKIKALIVKYKEILLYLVFGGLTTCVSWGSYAADALRAITIRAAEHVGVADWIGSIEVGKDADFVLTDKSIFDAEYEVIYTIIDGKIVGGKGL